MHAHGTEDKHAVKTPAAKISLKKCVTKAFVTQETKTTQIPMRVYLEETEYSIVDWKRGK